ncbi:MAG: TetR/AcrR family transcriptional regulator [Candidatus Binataceae bacterium]
MPKIVDAQERREKLIDATWRIIAREGIDAATVRRIAAEIGSTTGVVVHYFRDKDEIILAALQRACDAVTGRIRSRSNHKSALEALREAIIDALPLGEQSVMEWKVWMNFWGLSLTSARLAQEQDRRYDVWRGIMRGLLERAQRKGEIRPDAGLPRVVDHMIALIDGLGIQAILEPARMKPERIRAVVDNYIATLRASTSDKLPDAKLPAAGE